MTKKIWNNNLGLAYNIRSFDKSKKYFLNAIKIILIILDILNYANLLSDNELYDEAIENMIITSEKKPDFPDTILRLGEIYRSKYIIDKGNREWLSKAISCFEKSLQTSPSSVKAHVNLAMYLY